MAQPRGTPPSGPLRDSEALETNADLEAKRTEERDHHGDDYEPGVGDFDDDMDALANFVDGQPETSRQAKIETEYNLQRARSKVHWCRQYSSVVLLARKVSKSLLAVRHFTC